MSKRRAIVNYNGKEYHPKELEQFHLGVNYKSQKVTALSLYRKWVKTAKKVSFQEYVDDYLKENACQSPVQPNLDAVETPPQVFTIEDEVKKVMQMPSYSLDTYTPETVMGEMVVAHTKAAINGSCKSAQMLVNILTPKKIDVKGDVDVNAEVEIQIA